MSASPENLGTLQAIITADYTGLERAVMRSQQLMDSTAMKMTSIGKQMSMAVTAPLALIGRQSVKAFGDFDDAMVKSLAIMGDVSADMRREMEQTARSISTESVTSATELAQSYFFLASAGMDAEQSIQALAAVEKFAVAGAFNMSRATDLLTDAQSALGRVMKDPIENMKEMTALGDVLVKANTLANASVEQFSEALTNEAAAAMRNYNIELEEGVSILAAYADQGIKGQAAGSMFGRMTRLLISSINDNREAFTRLGIATTDSHGNLLPMADIFEDMTHALDGLGATQKAAALESLGFQARIQQAIMPLLGASDSIREYEAGLRDAGSITQEVADNQLQSFNAQMQIFWNRVNEVSAQIGELLIPHLKSLMDYVEQGIAWWKELDKEMQGTIVELGIGLALIGPGLVAMGTALKIVSGAMSALHAASLAALIPLAKIAAIAAVGYSVYKLAEWTAEWTGFSRVVEEAYNLILGIKELTEEDLKSKGIENLNRQLALGQINAWQYNEQLRELLEGRTRIRGGTPGDPGADPGAIAGDDNPAEVIRKTREEIQKELENINREREDAAALAAQEAEQEQKLLRSAELRSQVEQSTHREVLKLLYEGHELAIEMNELERQAMLTRAEGVEETETAIHQLFNARRELLEQQEQSRIEAASIGEGEDPMAAEGRLSTTGAFLAAQLGGTLGSGEERAQTTRERMLEVQEEQLRVARTQTARTDSGGGGVMVLRA